MEQREGNSLCQAHTASKGQSLCASSGSLTIKAHVPLTAPFLPLSSYLNVTMFSPAPWKEETPEKRMLESWLQEYYCCVGVQILPQGRERTSQPSEREPHGQTVTSVHSDIPAKCPTEGHGTQQPY